VIIDTLGPTPFYKLAGQWGTVRVRGTAIRPGTTNMVRTLADFSGGAAFSSAATAATWTWGDVDNNGMVNVIDVTNLVNALKGLWGTFTFEQMNLWGNEPGAYCTPDSMITVLDLVSAVDAVKGLPLPCSASPWRALSRPGDYCPVPIPTSGCGNGSSCYRRPWAPVMQGVPCYDAPDSGKCGGLLKW